MPGFWLEFLTTPFAFGQRVDVRARTTRFVAKDSIDKTAIALIAFHGVIPWCDCWGRISQ
jgi:hypothetical protein